MVGWQSNSNSKFQDLAISGGRGETLGFLNENFWQLERAGHHK